MTVAESDRDSPGRWLARAALLASLLVIAVSFLGPYLPVADIASNFIGHAIGVAIAALLALYARGREILVLLFGAVATYGAHGLAARLAETPMVLVDQQAAAIAGQPLKIVSLNTWHKNKTPSQITDLLLHEDPDVAVLVEFGPDKADVLRQLAARYPYQLNCSGEWSCSIALLSRFPIVHFTEGWRRIDHGSPRISADIDIGGRIVTVIAAHPLNPTDGAWQAMTEMEGLARLAREAAAKHPVIIAGDFNATPWSYAFRAFSRESGLTHMGPFIPSFPAGPKGMPQLAIDHMFGSREIVFRSVRLGPDTGSDHRPLIAEVTVTP